MKTVTVRGQGIMSSVDRKILITTSGRSTPTERSFIFMLMYLLRLTDYILYHFTILTLFHVVHLLEMRPVDIRA